MNFDPTIGLGSILVIVTMTVGGLGAFFTLRSDAKESGKRIGDLEKGHGKIAKRLTDFELSVAREAKEYVNRADLRDGLKEVEGRLGKRLDDVEHTVRNSATKMAGEVKDMLRDLLPRREGAR